MSNPKTELNELLNRMENELDQHTFDNRILEHLAQIYEQQRVNQRTWLSSIFVTVIVYFLLLKVSILPVYTFQLNPTSVTLGLVILFGFPLGITALVVAYFKGHNKAVIDNKPTVHERRESIQVFRNYDEEPAERVLRRVQNFDEITQHYRRQIVKDEFWNMVEKISIIAIGLIFFTGVAFIFSIGVDVVAGVF